MSDLLLVPWSGDDGTLTQVAELYADAFAEPPYGEDRSANRKSFPDRIRRGATKPDFRLILAMDRADVVGFVLGNGMSAGDWWWDRLSEVLPPETRREWLTKPCYDVAELAIAPTHRRRGIARALMTAVLADLPYQTAVLGCFAAATPARTLYTALGWSPIATDVSIAASPPLWILGTRLDSGSATGAAPPAGTERDEE